jgi:hypothetical protein
MATPVTAARADQRVSVELDLADMLAIGYSLQALARQSQTPIGTKAIYTRVGAAMVAAAQECIRGGKAVPK